MEFIHSCNVIHSDLTGRNVLLCVLSRHTRGTNGKLEGLPPPVFGEIFPWLLPVRNGISWNEFPEKPATDLQYGSPVPLL